MTARIHPPFHHRLGVGITERDIFCNAAITVADIVRTITQRGERRVRKNVRHFLIVGHVLRLDSRHLIQLRAEHQRSQTLMSALGVDQIEDASLRCAGSSPSGSNISRWLCASFHRRRPGRCNRVSASKLQERTTSNQNWDNPHAVYIALSQTSFQGAPDSIRIQ